MITTTTIIIINIDMWHYIIVFLIDWLIYWLADWSRESIAVCLSLKNTSGEPKALVHVSGRVCLCRSMSEQLSTVYG